MFYVSNVTFTIIKMKKFLKRIIWIIWDLIIKMSNDIHNDSVKSIIQNLFDQAYQYDIP